MRRGMARIYAVSVELRHGIAEPGRVESREKPMESKLKSVFYTGALIGCHSFIQESERCAEFAD